MAGDDGYRERSQRSGLIEEAVRELVEVDTVTVSGDMETAHAGATALSAGVLVYAGTGSNAFGRAADGTTARCGGWGYLIDDEGGAYQIGRAALKAAFRAADGRSDATGLTDLVLAHFAVTAFEDLTPIIYRDDGLDRPSVAALSTLVSEAAAQGDGPAREALAHAGGQLGGLATAVVGKLGRRLPIAEIYTSGGVFRAPEPLESASARRCARRCRTRSPALAL